MSGAGRIGGGFLALAAIWIGVYWFWEPSRATDVTFAEDEPPAASEPAPQPDPTPVETAPPPPVITPDGAATGDGAPTGTEAEPELPAVVPPQFREYVVRRDDTFSTISRREYGTSRHAGAIAGANPFVSPTNLREGQVLRIPADPENVQGMPVDGGEEPPDAPGFVEYVVASGDTLSEISQRFYGSLRYAEVIFNANRETMSDMDDLQIGQVLRIPSPESVLGEDDR